METLLKRPTCKFYVNILFFFYSVNIWGKCMKKNDMFIVKVTRPSYNFKWATETTVTPSPLTSHFIINYSLISALYEYDFSTCAKNASERQFKTKNTFRGEKVNVCSLTSRNSYLEGKVLWMNV